MPSTATSHVLSVAQKAFPVGYAWAAASRTEAESEYTDSSLASQISTRLASRTRTRSDSLSRVVQPWLLVVTCKVAHLHAVQLKFCKLALVK